MSFGRFGTADPFDMVGCACWPAEEGSGGSVGDLLRPAIAVVLVRAGLPPQKHVRSFALSRSTTSLVLRALAAVALARTANLRARKKGEHTEKTNTNT